MYFVKSNFVSVLLTHLIYKLNIGYELMEYMLLYQCLWWDWDNLPVTLSDSTGAGVKFSFGT